MGRLVENMRIRERLGGALLPGRFAQCPFYLLEAKPRLLAPLIVSPAKGATNQATSSVDLEWSEVADADAFDLQVSKNSDMSDLLVDEEDVTSPYELTSLDSATTYHWRVRSKRANDTLTSNWRRGLFSTINADFLTGLAWAFDGQLVIDEETIDYSLVCNFGGLNNWAAIGNPGSAAGPGNPPGSKLARTYNGVSQYHASNGDDLPSYKYPATGAWAEVKWIFPTSAASNRAIVGLCNGYVDNTTNVAWIDRLKTDLTIDFVFNNNGTLKTLSSVDTVTLNAWNSIFKYDDGAGNVFMSINGGEPVTTTRTSYAAHAGLTNAYLGYVDAVPYAGRVCQFQRWHNRYFAFDSTEGLAVSTGTGKLSSEMS